MNQKDNGINPKVKEQGVHVEKLGDETIVYNKATHRAHCLNPTMSAVWKHADGSRSVAQIAELLRVRFELPNAVEAVNLSLEQLQSFGLLEAEPAGEAASAVDIRSRRQIAVDMAKAGLSLSMLPLVASVLAPTPAMASSAHGACCSLATYQQDLGTMNQDIRQNSAAFIDSRTATTDYANGLVAGQNGIAATNGNNTTLAQSDFQSAISDFDGALKAMNLGPL